MKSRILSFLIIFTFVLSACAPGSTPSPTAAEKPSETAASPEVQTPNAGTDECLACHTDKDLLIATAKPVEAAESESKGVG